MRLAPAIHETTRCNWCSYQRPRFRIHKLASGQAICDYCVEWHFHALDVLAGALPKGCQTCGATWETLRDREPGVEVRLYVVPKDGMQQLMCRTCVAPYLPKRADLFAGTQFGRTDLKI